MRKTILALTMIICSIGLKAEVKLPSVISNNMVLMQLSEAKIWGKGTICAQNNNNRGASRSNCPSDWAAFKRYEIANKQITKTPDVVFIGNSITDYRVTNDSDFFKKTILLAAVSAVRLQARCSYVSVRMSSNSNLKLWSLWQEQMIWPNKWQQ